MIVLRWSQLPEADVVSYCVYRSIIGFCAPLVPLIDIAGKTLIVALNGGPPITITFDGTTPIVDMVNSFISTEGGKAFPTDDDLNWCLRSDIRCGPEGSVEIVGGTSLVDFGLTPRTITELSENEKIGTVPADPDPTCPVEFMDPDGVFGDYYTVTTIDSLSKESLKANWQQPVEAGGPLCIIEGVITDLQGVRQPDVEVQAEVQIPPEHTTTINTITKETITELTDSSGRFRMALLQDALVELKIPVLNLSRMVTVPNRSFIFIHELLEDNRYRYP